MFKEKYFFTHACATMATWGSKMSVEQIIKGSYIWAVVNALLAVVFGPGMWLFIHVRFQYGQLSSVYDPSQMFELADLSTFRSYLISSLFRLSRTQVAPQQQSM